MITIAFHNFWEGDDFVLFSAECRVMYEFETGLFIAAVVAGLGVSLVISR